MSDPTSASTSRDAVVTYNEFPQQFQSVILATVSEQGIPHSSYAPFVIDSDKNIYILTSELAVHTQDLLTSGKVSTLFIQEESQSPNIFARTRLSYDCTVTDIDRDTPEWQLRVDQMQARFGETVGMIRQLTDFHLLKLTPTGGRFTVGFGKIYDIKSEDLSRLIPVGGKPRR